MEMSISIDNFEKKKIYTTKILINLINNNNKKTYFTILNILKYLSLTRDKRGI